MIIDPKIAARKVEALIAAKKQAARKRAVACIDAYNENLTNTARQHLYDSVQEIKREYGAAIHAALEQADSEASESLSDLCSQTN